MRIYFVRHGLTLCNIDGKVQGMDDRLSEKGIQQAGILAERLKNIPFTSLVSSDMHRARTTAEIIGKTTGHTVMTSALFREFQYPASLIGHSFTGPEVEEYRVAHLSNADELDWKFEDEQSIRELRQRAEDAFAFAKAQPGDVVAVTHGRFLRHVIFAHLFGDALSPKLEQQAVARFLSSNTGITVFESEEGGQWKLLTWNDHAHLG